MGGSGKRRPLYERTRVESQSSGFRSSPLGSREGQGRRRERAGGYESASRLRRTQSADRPRKKPEGPGYRKATTLLLQPSGDERTTNRMRGESLTEDISLIRFG